MGRSKGRYAGLGQRLSLQNNKRGPGVVGSNAK